MSNMGHQENLRSPAVSIGMPVYNGERYIGPAIESILNQSFKNIELIISDNASTDDTSRICQKYALGDVRIRYIRQSKNIGPMNNFIAVLTEARAEYFKWQACDDVLSNDFIETNYNFLVANPEYVASTSPNGFEGRALDQQKLVDFKLDGDEKFDRYIAFFNHCWQSHGIFYSLLRTNTIRQCEVLAFDANTTFAKDWEINLYLASRGKINRTEEGYIIFGVKGVSRTTNAYKVFRISYIEFFIPFYYLSKYVFKLIAELEAKQKIEMVAILIKLNIKANRDRMRMWRKSII